MQRLFVPLGGRPQRHLRRRFPSYDSRCLCVHRPAARRNDKPAFFGSSLAFLPTNNSVARRCFATVEQSENALGNEIRWETLYGRLLEYRKQHGHVNVPQHHTVTEGGTTVYLGRWLDKQRQLKSRGILPDHRANKLEDLGVVWSLRDWNWASMIESLEDYSRREGHVHVPQDHMEDSRRLGAWLKEVRQLKVRNKLDLARTQQLEAMGVVWDMHAWKWDRMYRLLLRYLEREGHLKVRKKHKEEGENLGGWVARQRELYRAGKLDDRRYERLKAIGFWRHSSN